MMNHSNSLSIYAFVIFFSIYIDAPEACSNVTILQFVDPNRSFVHVLALHRQLKRYNVSTPHTVLLDSFESSPATIYFHERIFQSMGIHVLVRSSASILEVLQNTKYLWTEEFRQLLIFNETQFCKILFLEQDYLLLQNM